MTVFQVLPEFLKDFRVDLILNGLPFPLHDHLVERVFPLPKFVVVQVVIQVRLFCVAKDFFLGVLGFFSVPQLWFYVVFIVVLFFVA